MDRRKTEGRGSWATILTSIAALGAAGFSYLEGRLDNARQEDVSRVSYESLAETVEELADENEERHAEVLRLRGYLEGLVQSGFFRPDREGEPEPEPESEPEPEEAEVDTPRVAMMAAPDPSPPLSVAPPKMRKPRAVKPMSYDQVQKKAGF